mgnify:CR=1 FL=1
MPSLRDREEDIPLLCEHFIRHSETLRGKACRIRGISEEALDAELEAIANKAKTLSVTELDSIVKAVFPMCATK